MTVELLRERRDCMKPEENDRVTIGRRVRERRLQFGWSTSHLAKTAGVARFTIVRIENGMPSHKKTLAKVRHALRLWTIQMRRPFASCEDYVVHRVEEEHWAVSHSKSEYQKRLVEDDPVHVDDPTERRRLGHLGFQPFYTAILNSSLPFGLTEHALMEIYHPSWVDSHYGEEFVYCLRGEVTITVNGNKCELRQGEAMSFEAKHPHQYQPTAPIGKDDEPALILIVVTKRPSKRSIEPARPVSA